jgi:RNA polymerase sigma-70 factor (ECF subfamily)
LDSDELLLEHLARGEPEAFETLFRRYAPQVYRAVYRLAGSPETAEDILQETFLTLFRQPPRQPMEAPLVAWLCRVALNRGYNLLRSAQREEQRLVAWEAASHAHEPDQAAIRREEQLAVRAALARLPERQSRLLLLRHAGLSYAEIAAALELAPGSIGTMLVRAERAFLDVFQAGRPAGQEDAPQTRTT